MRGDNPQPRAFGAVVVDIDGKLQYHILANFWVKIATTAFIVLLLLCVLLGLMALSNRSDIKTLEMQLKEVNCANTSDAQR